MLSFTRWERKHSWSLDVVHAEVRDEHELLRSQTAKLGHLRCAKCKFMTMCSFRRKGHPICTASCFHVSPVSHKTPISQEAFLSQTSSAEVSTTQTTTPVQGLSPQGGKNTTLSLTEGHISSVCVCNKQKMCHKHKPSDKIDVVKLEFMCHQILTIKQKLHEGCVLSSFSASRGGAASQSLLRTFEHTGENQIIDHRNFGYRVFLKRGAMPLRTHRGLVPKIHARRREVFMKFSHGMNSSEQ